MALSAITLRKERHHYNDQVRWTVFSNRFLACIAALFFILFYFFGHNRFVGVPFIFIGIGSLSPLVAMTLFLIKDESYNMTHIWLFYVNFEEPN